MGFKDIPLALFFRLPGEVVGELARWENWGIWIKALSFSQKWNATRQSAPIPPDGLPPPAHWPGSRSRTRSRSKRAKSRRSSRTPRRRRGWGCCAGQWHFSSWASPARNILIDHRPLNMMDIEKPELGKRSRARTIATTLRALHDNTYRSNGIKIQHDLEWMIENKELKYTRIENQPAQLFEGPLSEPSVLSCGSIQTFATSRVELKAARKWYLKSSSDKIETTWFALLQCTFHLSSKERR